MKNSLTLSALLFSGAALAQGDGIGPLHAQPEQAQHQRALRNGLNEWFIYQYLPQSLPIFDDFSTDRTRHLDAQSGDAGVTLIETVYHLEVGGLSAPDQAFMLDPTYTYTWEVLPDTTILDTIENASVSVVVTDISTYPGSSQTMTCLLYTSRCV